MSYAETLAEHRRLIILRFLSEAPGFSMNTSLLHDLVNSTGAVPSSRDQIETTVSWLNENELVKLEKLQMGVTKVIARQRGLDVAKGLTMAPGIKQPSPEW